MSKILLVESNSIDAMEVQSMLHDLDHCVVGVVRSISEALRVVERVKPDILVLNAHLPGQGSVVEFTKAMATKDIPTILVSGRDQFDKEQYLEIRQHRPIGYLVKPLHRYTLASTIDILTERHTERLSQTSLFIKSANNDRVRIDYESIVYVQSEGNYIYIQTSRKRYALKRTLKSILPDLDSRFIRVHSRYIVNRHKVSVINGVELVVDEHKLPIGRTYKQALCKTMYASLNEMPEHTLMAA